MYVTLRDMTWVSAEDLNVVISTQAEIFPETRPSSFGA